jgi:hypothetical protein
LQCNDKPCNETKRNNHVQAVADTIRASFPGCQEERFHPGYVCQFLEGAEIRIPASASVRGDAVNAFGASNVYIGLGKLV